MAITYVGGITGTATGSVISNGVFDSYPESNYSGSGYPYQNFYYGQSFQPSTTDILSNCQFYIQWADNPLTGNIYAVIYNATGTHGTNAKPTGSPIATSDLVDASTVGGTMSLMSFNFSNRIQLDSGSTYIVMLHHDGDVTHRIFIGVDATSPTHGGNYSYGNGTTWTSGTTSDIIFYVNYISNPAITLDLTALTGGSDSSPSLNDIIIVSVASASQGARSLSVISLGYTEVAELFANDTYDTNLLVNYKLITGSVDTQILIAPSGNTSDALTAIAQVFRGVNTTNIFDVTSTTATGTNVGQPVPPAITPTTAETKIVCIGAYALNSFSDLTTATLSDFLTVSSNDTYDSTLACGSYNWSSGTYTPSQFGGGSTSTSASWSAVTLALRIGTQAINFVADVTPFTLTGITTGIFKGYNLISSVGTFTLTGINNIFNFGRRMINTVGTFTLTGISNIFNYGRRIIADTGVFILTGIDALLVRIGGFILTASTGVFNLVGNDNLLRVALKMINTTETFILTGISNSFIYGRKIIADTGAFVLTGINNILSKGISMISSVGNFVLTGINNTFLKTLRLIIETGTFNFTGYDIIFRGQGSWKIRNVIKNVSSWINTTKNQSSVLNTIKNNSSVTNSIKHTTTINNLTKNSSSVVNEVKL